MKAITTLRPRLVGKLNERQVLRLLQGGEPLSRADLVRESGLSAPTVSKAVASLLAARLVEEEDAAEPGRGRPAAKVRLASRAAQVVGISVDAGHCEVVAAGLDGVPRPADSFDAAFATPPTYDELLDVLEAKVRRQMARPGVATLGLGLSLPGLVDDRRGLGVLSPNVPMTDGRTPAADLAGRLGLPCVLIQESHALCLAERHYGHAKGRDDFAVLDVGTGVGLGVVSGGRLLNGHSGLAGEIGHLTAVAVGGLPCGCGNHGCLETLVSDRAIAARVSARLGRPLVPDDVFRLARSGLLSLADELHEVTTYLAVAVAAVVNLFNPAALIVHSRLFEIDPGLHARLVAAAAGRALRPSFADCTIYPAHGSKARGAVAAAVQHLTNAVADGV